VASIDGTVIVLADGQEDVSIELVGEAEPLAAMLHLGDLVNATGTMGASGRLIVDDPGALVRVAALGASRPPGSAGPASSVAQTPDLTASRPVQSGPIVALAAILGLAGTLVIGAFAASLYGPNRVRNWPNRLKSRITRI
jgi:hypothetical protein